MKEKEIKQDNKKVEASDDDFLDTYLNYGVVIKISLRQIPEVKDYIKKHAHIIVYQRASTNKIWICEDDGKEHKE